MRALPAVLAVGSLSILAASLHGGAAAGVVFAFLAAAFPVGLMLLGITRPAAGDRPGRALVPILLLLVVLVASIAGLLATRGRALDAAAVLGLPAGLAIQVFGLFVVPLVVVGLGFAWSFRDFAPRREEIRRLSELGAARRDS